MQAPRIAVAIATYRSDQAVLDLVGQIIKDEWPVESIMIVDSMGSGRIPQVLSAENLVGKVFYFNSECNLGSAGNLRKRLELGAEAGVDFVLALNHDAVMSRPAVESLLKHAHLSELGALYPLLFRRGKGVYNLTGTVDFAFRAFGVAGAAGEELVEVCWQSSNGALYSTAPLRKHGLGPNASLWMGWEDYLYGLQLRAKGYRQYVVTGAKTSDEYEYKQVSVLGRTVAVVDKPSWYLYYSTRNLLLINLYEVGHPLRALKTLLWAILMGGHVWKQRRGRERRVALGAYMLGILHGLTNQRGKWRLPVSA